MLNAILASLQIIEMLKNNLHVFAQIIDLFGLRHLPPRFRHWFPPVCASDLRRRTTACFSGCGFASSPISQTLSLDAVN
jgi:hypothetical protein